MFKTFQLSWEGMSEVSEPVNAANERRKQSAAEKMNEESGTSEQMAMFSLFYTPFLNE